VAHDSGQKTEQPTPRRIDKARREGRFFSSRESLAALQFAVFVAILAAGGAGWFAGAAETARGVFRRAFDPNLAAIELTTLLRKTLWSSFHPLLAAGGVLVLVSVAGQLTMTGMGFSLKRLAPDLRRLNPVSTVRELFRRNLWAFLKALVLLPAFAAAVYAVARDNLGSYLTLPLMGVESGVRLVAGSVLDLLWKAAGAFLVLGAIDFIQQRRRHQRELRMTKHEVREEAKEVEGNPHIKSRIRRLQRDLLRRRMMTEVKTATAIVVNPTHYAVALRYRLDAATAPVVVAKGKNYLARRIRELAIEHQVPLIENPPLAQALYKAVDVGQEIPPHLYRAVAEVLAYIYRLMNGRLPG